MKIDINSWHYKLMTLYKWSRKKESDWIFEPDFRQWLHSNWDKDIGEPGSLKQFRAFMKDTGTYQPVDFCTYWRNVLVYPGIFTFGWLVIAAWAVFLVSLMSFTGVAISLAMIVGFVVAITILLTLMYGFDKLKEAYFPKVKESFMSNVGKAIRNPELCSLVEYTSEKDAA